PGRERSRRGDPPPRLRLPGLSAAPSEAGGGAQQRHLLHLVADDLSRLRVSDRAAAAEAAGTARGTLERFRRLDRLQADAPVRLADEALSPPAEIARMPPLLAGVGEQQGNDLALLIHRSPRTNRPSRYGKQCPCQERRRHSQVPVAPRFVTAFAVTPNVKC